MTTRTAKFWDGIARKYAAQPIANIPAYEATLDRTLSYLSATDSVAEIGCGTGTTALKLSPHVGSYLATDISPEMITIAQEKAAEANASNVHFRAAADGSFGLEKESANAILAFNLLHLVDDLPASLVAIQQSLKPGGVFISKTPCLGEMNFLLGGLIALMRLVGKAPPRVARFTMQELEEQIRASGFTILERAGYPEGGRGHFLVARKTR